MLKWISFTVILSVLAFISAFSQEAENITKRVIYECENINISRITDGNLATHSGGNNICINATSDVPLEGIYIKYNKTPSAGTLNDSTVIAQNGFLHEYIPLEGKTSISIKFPETDICDIQIFSLGNLPENVQIWETGEAETDILLCATHSDDDQLFFAGLLPYYAIHKSANVRVAYFINHYDTYNRTHELLDGLWQCGIKNYPDISPFPDGYSESAAGAEAFLVNKGFEYSDFISFQRNLLDKYKPLVVVLHDFDGEYGHGAHKLNTQTFVEACENAKPDEFVPEKIYVHLYEKNPITLDIDIPLDEFDGLSAFNISQQAFGYHKSQHWTWFYDWIYGSDGKRIRASQIKSYNPAHYGLYFSSVGEDINKNDLLENVTTYSERKQIKNAIMQAVAETWKYNRLQIETDLIPDTEINNDTRNVTAESVSTALIIILTLATTAAIIAVIYNTSKRSR